MEVAFAGQNPVLQGKILWNPLWKYGSYAPA